jgi:hypothetical protein
MDRQAMDSLLVLTSIRTCYCKLFMPQQACWHPDVSLNSDIEHLVGLSPCKCMKVLDFFL